MVNINKNQCDRYKYESVLTLIKERHIILLEALTFSNQVHLIYVKKKESS